MMTHRQHLQTICGLLIILVLSLSSLPATAKTDALPPTQYLAFQVFTGAPSPNISIGGSGTGPLSAPPSKAAMKALVQDIVDQIGSTGDKYHKLAFIIGPLSFDHTD